ncbi:MAG: division/cell wall cluster transcriptional repressor MraZ [Deltaproteobacteria bacterium]|nr:division/cell wall cluster transcriptional repressor MraZ [Deltaproteobacteria bacterium]MBW2339491.1 division/cell wall cluster transcriptional repressor MraZ [Deltaproteobacteria bacterium]
MEIVPKCFFEGRSTHTLDEKGRLAIPARFREVLNQKGDSSIVVTNLNNCLVAFAREDWQKIKDKAVDLPLFDNAATIYLRYFISGAVECPLKQNRILIPPHLRGLAGLRKEVALVGHLIRFEIWDRVKWEEEFERVKESFPEASQSLSDLGI